MNDPRSFDMNRRIKLYCHCTQCLKELPHGESPASYSRLSVGFTTAGLQVWCERHDINVMHIDFQGVRHPAITTAKIKSRRAADLQ